MGEMNNRDSPQLIEAVRVWTAWGRSIAPGRDDARLVAANLQEMDKLASEQFKRKHPTVADEIVKAFAWCYTFDFK